MQTPQLSLELQLVLAGALIPLQPTEIERLGELCAQPGLDWEKTEQIAKHHGLAAVLYTNLISHAAGLVPESVKASLKNEAQRNYKINLHLTAEIIRLDKLLSPTGISICPIKGPLLSKQLYGDLGLRATRDIDLLLPEDQVLAAEKTLLAAGYIRTAPRTALSPAQWKFYKNKAHHFHFEYPKRRGLIEIHWALSSPDLLPVSTTRQFLSRARPLQEYPSMLGLADEDLFCFLVFHGAKHGWELFKWLADIALLMRRSPDLDWQTIHAQMAEFDLLRPLGQGLLLAQDLFNVQAPPQAMPLLDQPPVQRLAQKALAISTSDDGFGGEPGRFLGFNILRYTLGLKTSWKSKFFQLYNAWINPEDWDDLILPEWLFPLYIPLRPFLWLHRYHLPWSKKKLSAR